MDFITKNTRTIQIVLISVIVVVILIQVFKPELLKEKLANLTDTEVYVARDKDSDYTKVEYSGDSVANLPLELLPKSVEAGEFDLANPVGINSQDFLQLGNSIGISSTGGSNRNANTTLRSDPPITMVPIGPWNESEIVSAPDQYRSKLDSC
jgi:hypothetical protein